MAVYTVSQVTAHLQDLLELDPLLADLWVEGEVSNLRLSSAGHAYFSLKDGQSLLNCVMFRGQSGIELLLNGQVAVAHGRISFYQPRGSTDFMVDVAMPEGMGELALEWERLRLRLESEGLFEESRKRPLPEFPEVIGVVTSPTGAVFHDIQNVIQRRYPLVELVLSPALVQGADAAADIVNAIDALNRDGRADLMLVARGGGSLEELQPFNEEAVARAIYASRIPVVSAIGHETNVTIADMVADMRAPTPSAAAELSVPDQFELRRRLAELLEACQQSAIYDLAGRRLEVSRAAHQMEVSLPNTGDWRRRVDDIARAAGISLDNHLTVTRLSVQNREGRIRALDPAATLKRGFSVVQKQGTAQLVTSTGQVAVGDALSITVSDGVIPALAGSGTKPKTARKKPKQGAEVAPMKRLL